MESVGNRDGFSFFFGMTEMRGVGSLRLLPNGGGGFGQLTMVGMALGSSLDPCMSFGHMYALGSKCFEQIFFALMF